MIYYYIARCLDTSVTVIPSWFYITPLEAKSKVGPYWTRAEAQKVLDRWTS